MAESDEALVADTDCGLEICSSGNPRMVLSLIRAARAHGAFHRILVGTDTPGGTGILPRGMLREIAYLAAVAEVPPELAVAMATGNVARAHGLPRASWRRAGPPTSSCSTGSTARWRPTRSTRSHAGTSPASPRC
jgi:enamidase